MLGLLGGAGDASGKGLVEVGGFVGEGGMADADSRLGRMCSWLRRALQDPNLSIQAECGDLFS